jgi:glycosyltransferase involved in cell wall biosynthesis
MRVLFVSPYIPSRIRVRPYQWIRSLAKAGHSIHLVTLSPPEDRWAPTAELKELCEAVEVYELSRARTLKNMMFALPGSLPLQAAYSHHPDAERRLGELAGSGRFEVMHIEHLRASALAWNVTGIPRVFDAVDSIAHLFAQASQSAPQFSQRFAARLEVERTRRFEHLAVLQFDRTVVTSEIDAQAFRVAAGAAKVCIVPNGVDLEYFQPSSAAVDRATVLFSGKMSYHANAATALHLVRHVMPLIWAEESDARLVIAGKDPPPFVRALQQDSRIVVTGFVDDLRPFFRAATLVAAPLVYGAGIQNKVLEAMASAVPVVTTEQVAQALKAVPGTEFLVARDDREFAKEAVRLIRQPGIRRGIALAGRQYVEREHDWTEMSRRLARVYEAAAAGPQCAEA